METWLTFGVLFGAALAQGFLGFGFGILAMGALTLTGDVVHAAGLVNLIACVSTACMTFLLRRSVRWRRVVRILPWTVVGIGVGLLTLEALSQALLVRLLGFAILAVALWNLQARPLERPPSRAADVLAGLGAGLLAGAFNIPGPPLIAHLYRLRHPPEALKGTVQTLFLSMCLIRAGGAVARGQITVEIGVEALVALPAALSGLALGILVGRRVSAENFRRTSWIAFALLGLYLAVVG